MKSSSRVLISGVGIAGTTLAYWLRRRGFTPTLIESAPRFRDGGYVIDFWGAGYTVAEWMGLLPTIDARGYKVEEVRLVDTHGERVGGFGTGSLRRSLQERFVSLPRGDLAQSIFDVVKNDVEILFGDTIRRIHDDGQRVHALFEIAPSREFDVVIGADGLHSNVRSLVVGPQREFERFLGYRVAAFDVPNYRPRDDLVYVSYSIPGRQAARFAMRGDRTLILLIIADACTVDPATPEAQNAYLHSRFDTAGWECPKIMDALDHTTALYFDRVSQIRLPAWSTGRVALVGDAAFCPSLLAGEGASLAMTAAYVLAGELEIAHRDPEAAFARYEQRLRRLLDRKQESARRFAAGFAPRTALGLFVRNLVTRAMSLPLVPDIVLGRALRDEFILPEYPALDA